MHQYLNGIHEITNNAYHSSAGISRSMLMEFKRSPYHYWYKYISGLAVKEDATPAMDLGSAVHTLVLEESIFDQEFFVTHQKTKPKKDTAPYNKMMAEADGKIILTADSYMQAVHMASAVKQNEYAMQLLDGCEIEQSIYFSDKATGLQLKSRPDALAGSIVIDLKTTADATMSKFQSSAWNYGYYLQAAFAHRAMDSLTQRLDHFLFLSGETEPPFAIAMDQLDYEALQFGLQQLDELLRGLKRCLDTNEWPGYGIRSLGLPGYAKFNETLEIE